jgi:rubredoxin
MNANTQQINSHIMNRIAMWIKQLLEQSTTVRTPQAMAQLEQRVREEGQQVLGSVLEALVQTALDHQPMDRTCPVCGQRRRHKGTRPRSLLSSVGALCVQGPYWYCPRCGGQHALEQLAPDSCSYPMQEQLCLLGTALASFAKASKAAHKLLGVRVSDATIRRLCGHHGAQEMPEPVCVQGGGDVVGSCDGTMIHTRQSGWKELRAYQFRYDDHTYGRAYLESARKFTPRLRQAASAMHVSKARHLFWVADAAGWIDKGVRQQLPMAIRIIDLWHAWQHIYGAAQELYPQDEVKARQWARRCCRVLLRQGTTPLLGQLRLLRQARGKRRTALKKLQNYVHKHAQHLAYPSYVKKGYPISSGPMESFCKQLGQRLKGPGMRWNRTNVTPMATLVSLWATDQWDRYWQSAA